MPAPPRPRPDSGSLGAAGRADRNRSRTRSRTPPPEASCADGRNADCKSAAGGPAAETGSLRASIERARDLEGLVACLGAARAAADESARVPAPHGGSRSSSWKPGDDLPAPAADSGDGNSAQRADALASLVACLNTEVLMTHAQRVGFAENLAACLRAAAAAEETRCASQQGCRSSTVKSGDAASHCPLLASAERDAASGVGRSRAEICADDAAGLPRPGGFANAASGAAERRAAEIARDRDTPAQSARRAPAEGEEPHWLGFPGRPEPDDVVGTVRWLLLCRAAEWPSDPIPALTAWESRRLEGGRSARVEFSEDPAAAPRSPSASESGQSDEVEEARSARLGEEALWAGALAEMEGGWAGVCRAVALEQARWGRRQDCEDGARRRQRRERTRSWTAAERTLCFCRAAERRQLRREDRARWSSRVAGVLEDVAGVLRRARSEFALPQLPAQTSSGLPRGAADT